MNATVDPVAAGPLAAAQPYLNELWSRVAAVPVPSLEEIMAAGLTDAEFAELLAPDPELDALLAELLAAGPSAAQIDVWLAESQADLDALLADL